jgi:hypothetical protein
MRKVVNSSKYEESDKLIAIFMEAEVLHRKEKDGTKKGGFFDCEYGLYTPDMEVGPFCHWKVKGITDIVGTGGHQGLEFHCEWDWLMEVIKKIELNNHFVEIVGFECLIYFHGKLARDKAKNVMIWETGDTKFDGVYLAVIKFIKWHNGKRK